MINKIEEEECVRYLLASHAHAHETVRGLALEH